MRVRPCPNGNVPRREDKRANGGVSHEQHRQKRVRVSLASLMLADKEVPYLEGPEEAGSATEAVELFLLLFLSLLSFAPFLLS